MFIDYATIHVKAGDGGNGCIAFRREKYVPKGGPSGGDGGKGGDVYLVSSMQLNTLLDFRYRRIFKAKRGEHGKGSNKHGKNGESMYITVPIGTVVKDAKTGEIIHDFVMADEKFIIARGGKGGRGNARFATPTNQAPRKFEFGEKGEEKHIILELKLISDVGLIGYPNAGKSTLISKISSARPKIADYPFTTLAPKLGVVRYNEYKSFVVADIPGLIDGAHNGTGLGDRFLRHIERTRILAHLIDVSGIELRDPVERFQAINNELVLFNPSLGKKTQIVLATKIDAVTGRGQIEKIRQFCTKQQIVFLEISSVSGKGIKKLIQILGQMLKLEQ